MAQRVEPITVGIDVSKDTLAVFNWHTQQFMTIANDAGAIYTFLSALTGPVRLAIEPTSHYHLGLIEQAQHLGIAVYLVDPRQLVHYRQAVNVRHKSDSHDAWLLARFLVHEAQQLRPFHAQAGWAQQLWTLLKRRATVVNTRKQLQQSLGS